MVGRGKGAVTVVEFVACKLVKRQVGSADPGFVRSRNCIYLVQIDPPKNVQVTHIKIEHTHMTVMPNALFSIYFTGTAHLGPGDESIGWCLRCTNHQTHSIRLMLSVYESPDPLCLPDVLSTRITEPFFFYA